MRQYWTFSLYGPGMLWLFRVFFGSSNGTFLSRWSYVFDGETKEPGLVRLLPTSDIVFKLFSELIRAARKTVKSGISSLCDVIFRKRRCQRCHSKWNDLFWDTCASEDILVEYIAYYIHLAVRHDGIFGISGRVWIQCDLYKSKPFPSWSQSSINRAGFSDSWSDFLK